jgi:hypothetical protein
MAGTSATLGGVGKVATNAAEGKALSEGVGSSILCGGVAGGMGVGAGKAMAEIGKKAAMSAGN